MTRDMTSRSSDVEVDAVTNRIPGQPRRAAMNEPASTTAKGRRRVSMATPASTRDLLQREVGRARTKIPIVAITIAIAAAMKTNTPNAPKASSMKAMTKELKITESRLQE